MNPQKNLFVLGDSISMHYGPYLKDFLDPDISYTRKGEGQAAGDLNKGSAVNGGDSRACREYLKMLLADSRHYDILLWNCGLHDIKTTEQGRQVELEEYRTNLEDGVRQVKEKGDLFLIWVRTTPAFEDIHNRICPEFKRFHKDVIAYNKAADAIMQANGIPMIDLYNFTLKFGTAAVADHVHFIDEIRKLQAAFIAGSIFALVK